ncbi:MAG TPA: hypothetical protein VK612_12065 [Pyrinomonadaceae bacterium]|nr:hypothetical protein [Pyrinomonadaceae bacterium]
MARQFENSFDRFAQATSNITFVVLTVGVLALLFAGLIISIASKYWLVAVVFGLSVAGVLIFAVFTSRQQKRLQATKATGWIDWAAALPEIQRQNLTIAVGELSRILEVGSDSINDLQSAFIVAEDLALRQIQQEEQVPLMRHVSVAGVPFDAVFTKGDILVCGEVSFLVSPELRQERVLSMMKKIANVKSSIAEMNIGMSVRLMVILITQMAEEDLERLRATLGTSRFAATPVDIDIRLLDFETLQRIYVTD